MIRQRVMGLDVGDKKIGVAISDLLGLTAQGITVVVRRSQAKDIAELKRLILEYGVTHLVIGLPRSLNNSLGPQAEKVQAFASISLSQPMPTASDFTPGRFWT